MCPRSWFHPWLTEVLRGILVLPECISSLRVAHHFPGASCFLKSSLKLHVPNCLFHNQLWQTVLQKYFVF